EYESVVDHPLAEVFAWHTRPGAMLRLVPPWHQGRTSVGPRPPGRRSAVRRGCRRPPGRRVDRGTIHVGAQGRHPGQPHRADPPARRGGGGHRERTADVCQRLGIGLYGYDRGDAMLCEASVRGDGFLADVVADWEAATAPAADAGLRVATVRTGIVQSARGGTLKLMRHCSSPGWAAGLAAAGRGCPGSAWTTWWMSDTARCMTADWPDRSTQSARDRRATPNTPRRSRTSSTARRCCRCRPSAPGCCWALRVPANSPRPTSG
ncbi:MAG: hypothetical protein JWR37_928, partial [Mycobacterium sp.]|nr:hypothetical protein [Mycobacterium sp.]